MRSSSVGIILRISSIRPITTFTLSCYACFESVATLFETFDMKKKGRRVHDNKRIAISKKSRQREKNRQLRDNVLPFLLKSVHKLPKLPTTICTSGNSGKKENRVLT